MKYDIIGPFIKFNVALDIRSFENVSVLPINNNMCVGFWLRLTMGRYYVLIQRAKL